MKTSQLFAAFLATVPVAAKDESFLRRKTISIPDDAIASSPSRPRENNRPKRDDLSFFLQQQQEEEDSIAEGEEEATFWGRFLQEIGGSMVATTPPPAAVCSAPEESFTTSILFDFEGPIGFATAANIDELEDILKDSYNAVAGCDQPGAFITVEKVTIDVDIVESIGARIGTGNEERVAFTWLVSFEGTCRGCSSQLSDPPLFDESNSGTCSCDFPTVEAYSEECIVQLKNWLAGTFTLRRVTPYDGKDGAGLGALQTFTTKVALSGTGSAFSDGFSLGGGGALDGASLSQLLMWSYNGLGFLNYETCDQEERIITSLTPEPSVVQEEPDTNGESVFSIVFNIIGSCRGCGQSTVIFGAHQAGESSGGVACPDGAVIRCPSGNEVQEELQELLKSADTVILLAQEQTSVEPLCVDFVCGDGYRLRVESELRPGNDQSTCCIRDGVCAGAVAGSVCPLGNIDKSLIPNPSFENYTSCPNDVSRDTFSQLDRLVSWTQATTASSDFIVKAPACDDTWFLANPDGVGNFRQNASDGVAFVATGKIANRNWYEYIGTCLESPLRADTDYTLTLDIAAAMGGMRWGGDTNGVTELLCVPNSCEAGAFQRLPGGTEYRGNTPGVTILSTAAPDGGLVGGGEWKKMTFQIKPTADCSAIMFGPGLEQTIASGQLGTYVLYDSLNLQEGAAAAGVCTESGDCVEGLPPTAPPLAPPSPTQPPSIKDVCVDENGAAVVKPVALQSDTVRKSCMEHKSAGFDKNGFYSILPETTAANSSTTAAFTVYCHQSSRGGGWAMYAYFADSEGRSRTIRDPVGPCEFGVASDSLWQALIAEMEVGMFFVDENGIESFIQKSKLIEPTGLCIDAREIKTLKTDESNASNEVTIYLWHSETSGCDGTGRDYSTIELGDSRANFGATLWNEGTTKFDEWAYESAFSSQSQNELYYFVK